MSFLRSSTNQKPSRSTLPRSPVRNQPSSVKASAVAAGSPQYSVIRLGPRSQISPIAPGAASRLLSSATILAAQCSTGLPADSLWAKPSAIGSATAVGPLSVRP